MLTLVTTTARPHRQKYQLPDEWETAISGWLKWLRLTGMAKSSIGARRGNIRCAARRSGTQRPADVDLNTLVNLSDPDWSNDHRKSVRTSLVQFYDWCITQGICTHNPAATLPKVKESPPKPRPAPDDVWFALLDKAKPRERLMALLAGEVGMRRAEVAVAHRNDLLHGPDGYALIIHGKGDKQRVVPINDELAQEILAYCDGKHGYLFPGTDKWGNVVRDHITPAYVGKLVGDLMPAGWTMHKLRHRYATMGHAGTGNLRAVQEALGHVSVATTQKYVATTPVDLRRVSEAAHKRV